MEFFVLNLSADIFRDACGFIDVAVGYNKAKFFTAVTTGGAIAVYQRKFNNLGYAPQVIVTDQMAIMIIYGFKVIDIQQNKGKALASAIGVLPSCFQTPEQAPTIGKVGGWVRVRKPR